MPASMMRAPPVGIEYVSGSRMLIVASGPRPGSRPTSVPTTQPIAQYIRLCRVSAWLKPNARLWMISMRVSVQGQVQAEELGEDESDGHEAGRDLGVARHRVVAARDGRQEHHRDDAGDHVDELGDDREGAQAAQDQADVADAE